jgi:O-antigen ligase
VQKSISIPLASAVAAVAVSATAPIFGESALLVGVMAALALTLFAVLLLMNIRYAAFLALAVAAFTTSWTTLRALGGVGNISDLFLLLAAVLLLARRCALRDWRWDFGALRRLALPVFLLTVAGIMSTFQAIDPAGSLSVTAKISLTLLLVPVVIAEAAGSTAAIRALLHVFVAGAAVTSLAALSDMFLRTQFQLQATGAPPLWGRYAGLTAHPNDLGLVASLGIAAGLGLYLTGRHSRAYYVFAPIPLALCAAALVPSASLTAVTTAAVAVVTATLLVAAKRPAYLVAVAVVCTLGLGVVTTLGLTGNGTLLFARLEAGPQNASSLAERLQTYSWAWSQIEASPVIGHGMDQVGQGTTEIQVAGVQETRVHDQWMEIWYTAGLVGLIALALYYAQVWRLRTRVGPLVSVPCTAMLAVWLVDTLSQPSIYSRFGLFGVLCLIGACFVESSRAVSDARHAGPALGPTNLPLPATRPPAARLSALSQGDGTAVLAGDAEPSMATPPIQDARGAPADTRTAQPQSVREEPELIESPAGKLRRARRLLLDSPLGVLGLIALAALLLDIAIVDQREVWPPFQGRHDTERKGPA